MYNARRTRAVDCPSAPAFSGSDADDSFGVAGVT